MSEQEVECVIDYPLYYEELPGYEPPDPDANLLEDNEMAYLDEWPEEVTD